MIGTEVTGATRAAIERARERIATMVRETECRLSEVLSRRLGSEVFLKLENLQHSGSFKLRGVANRLLSLSPEEAGKPLIAASTGNHGAAFAHAVRELGLEGKLYLPTNASKTKLKAIAAYGIPYELVGDDCIETEIYARSVAREQGHVLVPPYNHAAVVAGQGTTAMELLDQLDTLDAVLVPVGGGGLIAGIATYLKSVRTGVQVLGCQPQASAVMYESIRAGRIIEMESAPTLSDATAGGIEQGSITFEMCRSHVDGFVLVSEEEIAGAIRFVHEYEGLVIEGGAALSVAAALKQPDRYAGRRIALIITGSKIDEVVLKEVLA